MAARRSAAARRGCRLAAARQAPSCTGSCRQPPHTMPACAIVAEPHQAPGRPPVACGSVPAAPRARAQAPGTAPQPGAAMPPPAPAPARSSRPAAHPHTAHQDLTDSLPAHPSTPALAASRAALGAAPPRTRGPQLAQNTRNRARTPRPARAPAHTPARRRRLWVKRGCCRGALATSRVRAARILFIWDFESSGRTRGRPLKI